MNSGISMSGGGRCVSCYSFNHLRLQTNFNKKKKKFDFRADVVMSSVCVYIYLQNYVNLEYI